MNWYNNTRKQGDTNKTPFKMEKMEQELKKDPQFAEKALKEMLKK